MSAREHRRAEAHRRRDELAKKHTTHYTAIVALEVEELRRKRLEDEIDKLIELLGRDENAYRYLKKPDAREALWEFKITMQKRLGDMYHELALDLRLNR